jgi:hypothetical protein
MIDHIEWYRMENKEMDDHYASRNMMIVILFNSAISSSHQG